MSNISQFFNSGGGDPQYWVSGTTYALGKTVRSPIDHQRYVRIIAGAGTTDPASDATNWRPDGGRPIKSVQRGDIYIPSGSVTGTAIVTAVNTAKAELRFLGGVGRNSGGSVLIPTVSLTNSTTVTAYAGGVVAGSMSCGWELTEYY